MANFTIAKRLNSQFRFFVFSCQNRSSPSGFLPGHPTTRVRYAYSDNILRIVAGHGQKAIAPALRLINFNEGTNQSIASMAAVAAATSTGWRSMNYEQGVRPVPPRYNNSSCQSHPSRSNGFDLPRKRRGRTHSERMSKTKQKEQTADSLSSSFSLPARSWFRTPPSSVVWPFAVADSPIAVAV